MTPVSYFPHKNNEMFVESYNDYLINNNKIEENINLSDHKKKVKRKILNLIKYII